jgi:ribonuclease Z
MSLRYPLKVVEVHGAGIIHRGEDFQVETRSLTHSIPCWGYVFRENQLRGHFDGEKAEREGIPSGPLRAQLIEGKTITLPNGKKIRPEAFVGPPRPGRTVAYCLEATFGHEHETEAHDWGHSTAADGAKIAKEAGVKRLILTHISQRYNETGGLLEEARVIFPEVSIANDLDIFYLDGKLTAPPQPAPAPAQSS